VSAVLAPRGTRVRRVALAAAAAAAALWGMLVLAAVVLLVAIGALPAAAGAGGSAPSPTVGAVVPPSPDYAPSAQASADIPPAYLALYRGAAARYGLDWTVLAGIGRIECDHGRDPAPSCTVEGQLNYAGAGGPAQFLISTFRVYGVSASGGPPDMWSPPDAVLSMANYLHASGAPGDYPRAIYAYNHAWWYVADVLSWARRYRALFPPASVPARPPRR